ncbi:hypothetical protein C8J56DRAFT_1041871 [Mycena floridula]|nr:hypothetical protein C8J56DRAFT_1041871 [Mycena floridula]
MATVLQVFARLTILLLGLPSVFAALQTCSCTDVTLPVHVDVQVADNPADPIAGVNSTETRPVSATYNVFGLFCEPETAIFPGLIQLLVHGLSYDHQYWAMSASSFQNYSYAAFSCARGIPSFSMDCLGAGLTSRPVNGSDLQLPTNAAVVYELAHRLKSSPVLPGGRRFNRVVGIGHSLGTLILLFSAFVEGAKSAFDSLLLTSHLHTSTPALAKTASAAAVDPQQWGNLDPLAYVTTNTTADRSTFYPSDKSSYSSRMLNLDDLTKTTGSNYTVIQFRAGLIPARGFSGNIATVAGSEDQIYCSGGRCDDLAALDATERSFWPDANYVQTTVLKGSGHDLNLDYFAGAAFETFVTLVGMFAKL